MKTSEIWDRAERKMFNDVITRGMQMKRTKLTPVTDVAPNFSTIINLADRLNCLIEDFNERYKPKKRKSK